MEKIGGVYIGEEPVAYAGEPSRPNAVYKIDAADWASSGRLSLSDSLQGHR
jgi:hypothetical protein